MDRYGWLKAMTQFSKVCGASLVNNQLIVSGWHDSYFGNRALGQMKCKKTQPFVLKARDSINDQPNNNGPNSKLKSLYNVAKSVWMLKYGTKTFSPRHMNSVLFEAWGAFNMSAGNIIRYSFAKTKLPPIIPTNLTANTQACAASIQVSSGAKD